MCQAEPSWARRQSVPSASSTSHSSCSHGCLVHHSPDERHGPTPATMRPARRLERIATGRPEARVTAAGAGGRRRRRARTGAAPLTPEPLTLEPLTLEPLTLPSPLRGEGEEA